MAGFGRKAHWYLNMLAAPNIELIMPGGAFTVEAEEVGDTDEAMRAVKQLFRNAGFAGFFDGYNPYTASDELYLKTISETPVMRLRPVSIGSGAYDPGGWLWITMTVLSVSILWLLLT